MNKYTVTDANEIYLKTISEREYLSLMSGGEMPIFELKNSFYSLWNKMGYNNPWQNERNVELPILFKAINKFNSLNYSILEVGAVSPYYDFVMHDICDPGDDKANIKIDVALLTEEYDAVVSISTIEHIGEDEYGVKGAKFNSIGALKHLNKLAKKELLITFPIGYNKQLDYYVFSGQTNLNVNYIQRGDRDNIYWAEVDQSVAMYCSYNEPFLYGNCVCILSRGSLI
jgi:hypothetical protein